MVVFTTDGRAALFTTAQLLPKTTRSTQGVAVVTLKKKAAVERAVPLESSGLASPARYRVKTLPAAGAALKPEDLPDKQMKLDIS